MFGVIGQVVGGLGIFLLAIQLMTEGLRLAGGDALRGVLRDWTRTTGRGLLAGMLITVLVQSSSAVTVATIGFVNAGLMSLAQAVGVVYGSNIGTTATGWLVAALGFKFDIEAIALPLVGLGAALRLSGSGRRRGALGEAIAGFGLFFIGIAFLKSAFEGMTQVFDLAMLSGGGIADTLGLLTAGFLLTVLTQSSSAAVAITLTAASGGVLTVAAAAAVVIGANVGTTSTAVFAAVGATPNAKRVAAAHVGFNLLTGAVALALLPVILGTISGLAGVFRLDPTPALSLALFHTLFNMLGVLLLWPLTRRLSAFLETRFRSIEEDEAQPRYLDRTMSGAPALGVNALVMELGRVEEVAQGVLKATLGAGAPQILANSQAVTTSLVSAINDFVTRLHGAKLSSGILELLPKVLRVTRYFQSGTDLATHVGEIDRHTKPLSDSGLRLALNRFTTRAAERLSDTQSEPQVVLEDFERDYQAAKNTVLAAGAGGLVDINRMAEELERLSLTRRMVEQYLKGKRGLAELRDVLEIDRASEETTAEEEPVNATDQPNTAVIAGLESVPATNTDESVDDRPLLR